MTVGAGGADGSTECPAITDRQTIQERYADYLTDESRMLGLTPDTLYLPENTTQVAAAVRDSVKRGRPLVVSGGRTGIVGGAVGQDGLGMISLDRMTYRPRLHHNGKTGAWTITVGSGTRLDALQEALRSGEIDSPSKPPDNLFYPVDPTEMSASVGGTVATNASGARTLFYGPTRDWVVGMEVVLASGETLQLRRDTDVEIPGLTVSSIQMPNTKHTAGYHMRSAMHPIDLFIGAEGTLGIITQVELRLVPQPAQTLGLVVFLHDQNVVTVIADILACETLEPTALEYMDRRSLDLLREYRADQGESSGVPVLPDSATEVLYIEAGLDDDAMERFTEETEKVLGRHGISMDEVWAGFSDREIQAMKTFRHALPERINSIISDRKRDIPDLTKIGTDMAVPLVHLDEMMSFYRSSLEKADLEYFIFGHIGNGHVHVNITPRSSEERQRAWDLYTSFAEKAVMLNGSVAGEHGIGRLKRKFMTIQYTEADLEAMKEIKRVLDPNGILNPGVLL